MEFLFFRIQHAGFKVVSAEYHTLCLADNFAGFSAAVVDQAGIAFLRHCGRNVGIVSALL